MPDTQLPQEGGSYILLLWCEQQVQIQIGAKGLLTTEPGYYLYTGSAFGSGGLRARLGRHLAGSPKKRWHIDYLRAACEASGAWYTTDVQNREHAFAAALSARGMVEPFSGFGASDCDCTTHLYFSKTEPRLSHLLANCKLQRLSCKP